MNEWPVDFGSTFTSEERAKKYRGYNPAFYERVMAKRKEAEKEKLRKEQEISFEKITGKKIEGACKGADLARVIEVANKAVEIGFNSIQEAQTVVATLFDIPTKEMFSNHQSRAATIPKHAAILAVRAMYPDLSLTKIGKAFGMDHSSIFYALKKHGVVTASTKKDVKND